MGELAVRALVTSPIRRSTVAGEGAGKSPECSRPARINLKGALRDRPFERGEMVRV
jgi:hypothetical protein